MKVALNVSAETDAITLITALIAVCGQEEPLEVTWNGRLLFATVEDETPQS